MNLKRVGMGLVLAMGCLGLQARAEMPRLFYFEDYCTTTNDAIELQLQLYSTATNGACLYEDSNTVGVVDGFYATLIGDNTVFGSLTNALAGGQTYVQVIIDGVPLSPREPLVPVPYALNAAGVASNAITSSMIANGAISTNKLAADVDDRYVNTSGSEAMDGDLSLGGGRLLSVSVVEWAGDGIDLESHQSSWPNVWANWNADMLDGHHASDFLNISGGTMTGALDMGGNQITNFSKIVFASNPSYVHLPGVMSNYYSTLYYNGGRVYTGGNISEPGFSLYSILINNNAQGKLLLRTLQYTNGALIGTNFTAGFETSTNVMNEIKVIGHLNMQGSAISNAIFTGDAAGLTNFPALTGYIQATGGTMTGPLELNASTDQTNLIVAGWAKIDYIPQQGGISMGIYTNR